MQFIDQTAAFHVIGIELRTTNVEASRTIPPHWRRFSEGNILAAILDKISDDVFAVYTNFDNAGRDNAGLYSLVIGAAVQPGAAVPAGMVRVTVPASRRATLTVADGRNDLVGAKWQEIWQRHDLAKTFIADYERYAADGGITIHIGVERETMRA